MNICNGEGCKAENGIGHSEECERNHDKAAQETVKIVSFQAMPDDEYYQGCYLALDDKGVIYMSSDDGWVLHVDNKLAK